MVTSAAMCAAKPSSHAVTLAFCAGGNVAVAATPARSSVALRV
jgi:hypothetical protein